MASDELPAAGVKRYYSVEDIAAITGLSATTLYRNHAETGQVLPGVPAMKVRRRIIVPAAPVDRLAAGGVA